MPREVTQQAAEQLESVYARPVFLVSCAFASSTEYMWTGVGDLQWAGITWKGMGVFGSISTIGETSEVEAQGITLTLSGIPKDLLSDALTEMRSSKHAMVHFGFLDVNGNIIPDPIPAFIGLMDQPSIDLSTETATISITVENRLADLNRSRGGRYTDQNQRSRYPNDRSLSWVHYLQDAGFRWK